MNQSPSRERELRVLVLDADMVPCLTIARSLHRRGCRVFVASHVSKALTSYSRAVQSVWTYPHPLSETDQFLDWLVAHTREHQYDLIIPVTERSLVPISRSRDRFAHVKLAIPSAESLDLVLDKSRTVALAESLGVPAPAGQLIDSMASLESVLETIRFPVVIKPSRSIGQGDAGASQLRVGYAFDKNGLIASCKHALRFGEVILQEYFRGDGVGIELIAKDGEVFYAFQHLRLHEVPLTGGGSSWRQSEAVDPALLEASTALMKALKWNGVAMVEFKLNRDTGEFSLMEINGRFWGSLPLADAAGADFPSMLLDLEVNDRAVPCADYRVGVSCRLLSRDLAWCEAVLRSGGQSRLVTIPSRKRVLSDMLAVLRPSDHLDVQSWRDPMPGLVDIFKMGRGYVRRATTLLRERRFLRQQRGAWSSGEVERRIVGARTVLIMCYGNINRSALADALVRDDLDRAGIRLVSAGFHPQEGRPADPVMVEVARSHGVDMQANRSRCVSEQDVSDSDVIFVMEPVHYDRLLAMNPSVADRTFLLGAHPNAKGWGPTIEDPYGRSPQVYAACFARIAAAADVLKGYVAAKVAAAGSPQEV